MHVHGYGPPFCSAVNSNKLNVPNFSCAHIDVYSHEQVLFLSNGVC